MKWKKEHRLFASLEHIRKKVVHCAETGCFHASMGNI